MEFAGISVEKGERKIVNIEIARLYDNTTMILPFEVIRGREDGPVVFISSALHGDELNGTETIRRLLEMDIFEHMKGTIIAVPIVNVYGFNTKSRYLPDRRDLNRSFPGGPEGSLASQLAHVFTTEIVDKCTHGIDLHTGAVNRSNLPQIRACFDAGDIVQAMAKDFGAPVTMDEPLREGSLREYCYSKNIPVILYEGGEALRYSEKAITYALDGIINVMTGLGMIEKLKSSHVQSNDTRRMIAASHWIRAPQSGLLVSDKKLGDMVEEGDVLGHMTDAFNHERAAIICSAKGIIIGATTTPLLNQGDATYHIAYYG